MRQNRPLLLFAAFLFTLAALGSLHFWDRGIESGASLTVLSPHGDNIRQEIGVAFSDWHAARHGEAVTIQWMDQGGTSDALKFALSRFEQDPAGIGVDLFFGGGTPPFQKLADRGLLIPQALPQERLEAFPGSLGGMPLRDDSAGWYGVVLSGFGVVYNKPLISGQGLPEIRTWSDLAEPELLGWVAAVDPRGSGSAHVVYEIILQKYGWRDGWRILMGLAANATHFTKGASGVLPLVTAGEAAYTIAIDLYAWSLIQEAGADKVGFLIPEGESVITPDPVAILRGAPNETIARRFLDFVFSPEAQRIWMYRPGVPGGPREQGLHRMSILPALYPPLEELSLVQIDPFSQQRETWTYSDSLTGARWSLLNDLLGLWMVDEHPRILPVWKKLAADGRETLDPGESHLLELYLNGPGTWDELAPLASLWSDDTFRNRQLAAWARQLRSMP